MSLDGSVTHWIAQLELGRAEEAEERLWQRYFRRLLSLAKLKLGETPRTVADEEDVATAALQSFFEGVAKKSFPRLHDRNELWPLLAKITACKALDQQRYLLAEKRGGRRMESPPAASDQAFHDNQLGGISDTEPGPEFLAAMSEQCDRLMNLLGDDQLRQIARRRFEGFTNAEIAREIGVIERTVERRLHLIRSLWAGSLRDSDDL